MSGIRLLLSDLAFAFPLLTLNRASPADVASPCHSILSLALLKSSGHSQNMSELGREMPSTGGSLLTGVTCPLDRTRWGSKCSMVAVAALIPTRQFIEHTVLSETESPQSRPD